MRRLPHCFFSLDSFMNSLKDKSRSIFLLRIVGGTEYEDLEVKTEDTE